MLIIHINIKRGRPQRRSRPGSNRGLAYLQKDPWKSVLL